MVGIYINGKEICEQILSGNKRIETRNHTRLQKFIGYRVGLIQTGTGKPKLVGYATMYGMYEWFTEEAFRKSEHLHKIHKGSKYDFIPGKKKVGYEFRDVIQLKTPIVLEPVKGNRLYRNLNMKEVEA